MTLTLAQQTKQTIILSSKTVQIVNSLNLKNMFIKLEQSHDKIPTRSQKRFVESSRSMIENLNNPKIQGATTLFHVMIKPAHLSR